MGKRRSVHVKVDEDVWDAFKSFVVEIHGQKYGNLGREAENALKEYVDRDRLTRVEANTNEILTRLEEIDGTHTHKASEATTKTHRIARRLAQLDSRVFDGDAVRRAIETVAGADDRTVGKYREQLKRQGEAYEHPADDLAEKTLDDTVWTLDRDMWATWAGKTVDNSPTAAPVDIVAPYPMDLRDFERLTAEVTV